MEGHEKAATSGLVPEVGEASAALSPGNPPLPGVGSAPRTGQSPVGHEEQSLRQVLVSVTKAL